MIPHLDQLCRAELHIPLVNALVLTVSFLCTRAIWKLGL